MAKFNANIAAQPVYTAVHEAIKDLPPSQALEVLGEIHAHLEGMIEGMEGEQEGEE